MATTLNQWEVGPFNAGVNASMIPTEIDDSEAVVIQDMLLDKPGIIYARGPVQNVVQQAATFNGTAKACKGFFSTNSPDGKTHLGTVSQDQGATNLYFTALNDAGNAVGISITLDTAFPLTSDCIVDAKPALGGGLWIGTQELPNAANVNIGGRQCLFHWRGATLAKYTTGTIAWTVGSTAVVGTGTSWTTVNVAPGMFIFYAGVSQVLGVVKSLNVGTQTITLEAPALAPTSLSAQTYSLESIRGWMPETAKGRISTTVGSPTLIGSGTKFQAQPLDNNWNIYRGKDNTRVGVTTSIAGDEGATMVSNATVAMDNEPFRAVANGGAFGNFPEVYLIPQTLALGSGAFPGVFNTTYAGLQWFARQDGPTAAGTGDMHSRLWFSDYRNMNSLDLFTQDGDYIQVTSTVGQNRPITGVSALTNALLVFKENETFAVTGDSPANFAINKIWDDGCLSAASIVQYKSTIIWAGRNGIYLFDGTKITNLVDRSLGNTWQNYIAPFDTRVNRLTGAIYQDHYFLSNSSLLGNGIGNPPYSFLKNGVSNPFTMNCISIYIPTKALSYHTAPNLIGSARVGLSTYFVEIAGYVCDFALLFGATTGQKDFPNIHANPWTPDPCFESKWMSMKDPLRKKMFKQILATLGDGSNGVTWPVVVEVAPGLGVEATAGTWTVLGAAFPTTATSYTSRIKFLKRERYLRVKMYQNVVGNSSPGLWSLRRFAIAFKLQKLGRL